MHLIQPMEVAGTSYLSAVYIAVKLYMIQGNRVTRTRVDVAEFGGQCDGLLVAGHGGNDRCLGLVDEVTRWRDDHVVSGGPIHGHRQGQCGVACARSLGKSSPCHRVVRTMYVQTAEHT